MKNLIIICAFLLIISVFGIQKIKYDIQNLNKNLEIIQENIGEDKEALHVLKAEWAYLSNPVRIDTLARKYLDLKYTSSAQVRYNKEIGSMSGNYSDKGFNVKGKPVMKPILSSAKLK